MKKICQVIPVKLMVIIGCAIFSFSNQVTAQFSNQQSRGKVLIVLSSKQSILLKDGKSYATGYYLNELMVPVVSLIEAGYEPVFANPLGKKVYPDEHSVNVDFFSGDSNKLKQVIQLRDELKSFQNPLKLSAILKSGLNEYKGIFFPGGHAPMGDLIKDVTLGKILSHFHSKSKPTALICHAPIALLSTIVATDKFYNALVDEKKIIQKKLSKNWIYKGYKMTIFSSNEEKMAEVNQLGGKLFFYPDEALKIAGGNVKTAKEWSSNAVRDRELITGQNPYSDDAFSKLFIEALNEN